MKHLLFLTALSLWLWHADAAAAETERAMRFQAQTPAEARAWQEAARAKLFALLMNGRQPERVPLDAKVGRSISVPSSRAVFQEISLQSLSDRRVHAWLARPLAPHGKVGAVLALHGHGSKGADVVDGTGLYWYGRALIDQGYVVIAPDIGQHELQHTNWTLMGERTWDALRCLDFLASMPEVDTNRLAVAGLSLGGETTMYVAALDERIKAACSSGWLTTLSNIKNGHCTCYNFPGLEQNFEFSDIFACVAPRPLVCELGLQEQAPGGFPVPIGRAAFEQVRAAYRVFNAESNLTFSVHPGPHVFYGEDFWPKLYAAIGRPEAAAQPLIPDDAASVAAWIRFTDAPEALDGIPYYSLARTSPHITFDTPPQPGDALELRWGSRADNREAVVMVNGKPIRMQVEGYWGFHWQRVPLPEGLQGSRYEIDLRGTRRKPAFFSEVRLTSSVGVTNRPSLTRQAWKAKLTLGPSAAIAPTPEADAFPSMRKVWDTAPTADWPVLAPSSGGKKEAAKGTASDSRLRYREAEKNARLANEAFYRCRRYVDGWLAYCDPVTGLFPRNLRESYYWNGRDSAADNYPFMVLTAAMTDRPLMQGRLLDMLRTETRLTSRLGRLPDDYSFATHGWRREKLDVDAIIFDSAEYVKDGLLYVAEWVGPSPWTQRMVGITDDIWKYAPIETPYGKIPTLNFEVCGDMLQASARMYWFTGDRKYLDYAVRLGDYFLLGTNHPTRNMKQLRLSDHGCEVINGLSELYVAVSHALPRKKKAYEQPIHEMFDCILAKGRNPDGLFYVWFNPQTGEHSAELCDTWGYDYDGVYTMWQVDKTVAYRDAVRKALGNLRGKYVGTCWADKSADGFADSIEGAINLFNREPDASAADWTDSQTRMMWSIQKPSGLIEAWHGDGNFARTSLMYALWKTQGVTAEPWRSDLRFGAAREAGKVYLTATSDQPWEGRLVFDQPRHKLLMHLPLDYTRINQFPEWFTVEAKESYLVQMGSAKPQKQKGAELAKGIPVKLKAGEALLLEVTKR